MASIPGVTAVVSEKFAANIAELESIINELNKIKTETINTQKTIQTMHAKMLLTWAGESANAFLAELNTNLGNIQTAIDVIEGFIKYAVDTKNTVEETDRAFTAMIKAINDLFS